MKFAGNVFITNNSFYENVIKIYSSGSSFQDNITIINNTVRQIFDCSYIFMRENAILNIHSVWYIQFQGRV